MLACSRVLGGGEIFASVDEVLFDEFFAALVVERGRVRGSGVRMDKRNRVGNGYFYQRGLWSIVRVGSGGISRLWLVHQPRGFGEHGNLREAPD